MPPKSIAPVPQSIAMHSMTIASVKRTTFAARYPPTTAARYKRDAATRLATTFTATSRPNLEGLPAGCGSEFIAPLWPNHAAILLISRPIGGRTTPAPACISGIENRPSALRLASGRPCPLRARSDGKSGGFMVPHGQANTSRNLYKCCSMASYPKPSKLVMRVRFPSPAPACELHIFERFQDSRLRRQIGESLHDLQEAERVTPSKLVPIESRAQWRATCSSSRGHGHAPNFAS